MHPYYETKENNLEIYEKRSVHVPPHLHKSLECIYVTKGTLELGIGEDLFHMEEHDFGIVFPNLVHHYQVFASSECRAIYLLALPQLTGIFSDTLRDFCPEIPIIPSQSVHPDIIYSLHALLSSSKDAHTGILSKAYTQIVLARALPCLKMISRSKLDRHDIVYNVVAYMAEHFTEEVTLPKMAADLGLNQYALSRVFSSTFHTNFNQYLNELRLDYAVGFLENTSESITDICLNAGFTSLRTFNRVFKDRFRLSPREYRKLFRPLCDCCMFPFSAGIPHKETDTADNPVDDHGCPHSKESHSHIFSQDIAENGAENPHRSN